MADKLTPQQQMAVMNRGGNLLVSAAAGSGKTKVLVDRLLSYLMDAKEPANLDDFLIITYTKAAASELRGKIAAKLTEKIAQVPENRHLQKQMQRLFLTKISTVHGFCSDLLHEYAYRLDIPADFRVGDENECREIRETVLTDLIDKAYAYESSADFRAFVDSQGLGRDDRLIPEIIEKVYDSAHCHLNPEGWLESCLRAADTEADTDASQTIWGSYLMQDLKKYLQCQIQVLKQCAQALDEYKELEKPAINIRNTLNQLEILEKATSWDEIVNRRNIDYGRLTFPKKNNPDLELCERVKWARNACKKGLERKLHAFADASEQVLEDLSNSSAATRGLIALVKQFKQDYSAAKQSRRILDFSDLEQKTLDLLWGKSRTNPTAAATEIGRRYREILVDEYQDSNGVQDAIFEALTKEKHNCFLVGDVKQSIYQFRLADPGIFLEKYHSYVPASDANPGQGRKVLLSHNFRSGGEIVAGVNDVFRVCMSPDVGGLYYGEEEALREGVPHEPLREPGVELYAIDVREETYPEEAAFVAEKIKSMLQSGMLIRKEGKWKPIEPDDIVILLRSPGTAAGYFQRALENLGIPCISGGGSNLLETEEIATLRSFLQTIHNPRLDIPLISTLASPIFGFTADDLASIRGKRRKGPIYDALLDSGSEKVENFLDVLSQLRQCARMNTLTVLLETCINLTRMDSIYGAMADGERRRLNLQTFYQVAADFEKGSLRDLSQFLDHLDALESRGLIGAESGSSGFVNIMSIHKSKGLEFPVVFLCNLSRKFNQESLRSQILCDRELGLGLSVADHGKRIRYPSIAKKAIAAKMATESLSEEMRVLYVAMTRARDRLIMTYAAQKIADDLQEVALRTDFDGGRLLCKDAICMGDWILIAAMGKTEAGEFHALGGKPLQTNSSEFLWKIRIAEAPVVSHLKTAQQESERKLPDGIANKLKQALAFEYAHIAATVAPSKQTATDRKGRFKDAEAAEKAQERSVPARDWRKPTFLKQRVDGRTYGNAIHAAMQYLKYEQCGSRDRILGELDRLVQEGFLRQEQRELVNVDLLFNFFASPIGCKLRSGVPYLREFKFSVLDNGSNYAEALAGEQVLLQGVVDCAILEQDGITIVDFKTDYVTEETLHNVTERYRPQLETYAEALHRIYEMPIKKKCLYYFRMNRMVEI